MLPIDGLASVPTQCLPHILISGLAHIITQDLTTLYDSMSTALPSCINN